MAKYVQGIVSTADHLQIESYFKIHFKQVILPLWKSQLLGLETFWKIIHSLISQLQGCQNYYILDCNWSHSVKAAFLSRDHLFTEIHDISQGLIEVFSILFFSINTRAEQSSNLQDRKCPASTAAVIKPTSHSITHSKSLPRHLLYSHTALFNQTKISYFLRSADLSVPQDITAAKRILSRYDASC